PSGTTLLRCVSPPSGDPRCLRSFPTRRSSDLRGSGWPAHQQGGRRDPGKSGFRGAKARQVVERRQGGRGRGKGRKVEDMSGGIEDRKSTRLNSSHVKISYAVFCLKKKKRAYSN